MDFINSALNLMNNH